MNILYLAHRIPYPPTKGDKIRSFNLIKHLSRTHTIHLACLVDDRGDWGHLQSLEKWCANVDAVYRSGLMQQARAILGVLKVAPLTAHALYSVELQRLIAKRLASGHIDRIVLSSSGMAEYVREVVGIPRIMDLVDLDSEKWRAYGLHFRGLAAAIYRVEAGRLARYEETIARTFEHCLVVSEGEAKLLRRRFPQCPVTAIPNGVDLEWFARDGLSHSREERPTVVFTGAMDYAPNVDAVGYFCSEVLPLVTKSKADLQFWIVGSNPTAAVKALARDAQVVVTGTVTDVRPFLARAWVAVAPLRIARGLQNKVLEAMAMGLPVVGTSQAFQGTMASAADGIRIADRPHDMANAILDFIADTGARQSASHRARQYVERAHRWEDQIALLERVLQEVSVPSA